MSIKEIADFFRSISNIAEFFSAMILDIVPDAIKVGISPKEILTIAKKVMDMGREEKLEDKEINTYEVLTDVIRLMSTLTGSSIRSPYVMAGMPAYENTILMIDAWEYRSGWEAEQRVRQRMEKDPRVLKILAAALEAEELTLETAVGKMAEIDREFADKTFLHALEKDPKFAREDLNFWEDFAERNELPLSLSYIGRMIKEERLRDSLSEKMQEITRSIKEKIAETLGLEANQAAKTEAGNGGTYGSISMGMELSLKLKQELKLELVQQLLPRDGLTIEEGETIAEIQERIRTLNFLVHHEVGHLIQEQKKIDPPEIRSYPLLDQKNAKHQANEIIVDKLAFEAARKVYVHGDGDVLFDAATREVIAIKAHLTLGKVILRNLEAEKHTLSDECVARLVAVLQEAQKSKEITKKTRSEILKLAKAFRSRLTTGQEEAKTAEIDRLIKEYRKIFRSITLEV
jgi:hypothetical protein